MVHWPPVAGTEETPRPCWNTSRPPSSNVAMSSQRPMRETRKDGTLTHLEVVCQMNDMANLSEAKKIKNQVVRSAHRKLAETSDLASNDTVSPLAASKPLKYAASVRNPPAQ